MCIRDRHHPIEYQNHIFDALMEAGAEFQLKPFGIRAMDAMRLEKSYRMVAPNCRSNMRHWKVALIASCI